ncbi:MAG: hypothetical protein RR865_07890, partial [Clostridia bacterium]
MRNCHSALLHPPAGGSLAELASRRYCIPLRGDRAIAEMAFRATHVGAMRPYDPHISAKEYAENSGTHSKQKPLDADEF